jgi:hypothetical protein
VFFVFFCLGGFLFYIPKWILMGTKGERQRKATLKELRQIRKQALTPNCSGVCG